MPVSGVFSDSVLGFLAPIRAFLEDPEVTEIMINGYKEIFIEKKGLIEKTGAKFNDEDALMAAAINIAQYVKRKIGGEHATMDARLPDGSRIHIVVPPVAKNGTTIAIRKFSKTSLTLKHLIKKGSISVNGAKFIDVCVYLKKNMIISGGTGSGKTTILNMISGRINKKQRILVIEDSSELNIPNEHVIYFETRQVDNMGKGEVTIRDLVKSSLRLRPDRVIVGEVRGAEALDLINSMNTGHSGSMGTVHANTPEGSLVRLETLSMIGDSNIPVQAIRAQVASAIQIIIQTSRMNDGSRKIVQIAEVLGMDDRGKYQCQDIFRFIQRGRASDGTVLGVMEPTGKIPTFWDEVKYNNIPLELDIFDPKKTSNNDENSLNGGM